MVGYFKRKVEIFFGNRGMLIKEQDPEVSDTTKA
jgi:hypothetical protein